MTATISFFIGCFIGAFVIGALAVGGDSEQAQITELDADHRASLILSYMKENKSDKEMKTEIKRIIRL